MLPLDPAQRDAYLDRIGATLPEPVDAAALTVLQLAHLRSVPFENLDIHRGRPISIDPTVVYRKVVERRRGGYCYELNSLFARLLTTLGCGVDLLSARVACGPGCFGPEFDHLTLAVTPPTGDARVLVDVGFGDAFIRPLPLVANLEHDDAGKRVRLTRHGDDWWYEEDSGEGWAPQYTFTDTPRELAAFATMNTYQQSSPDSHFTRQVVCSRLTPTGRTTVAGERLIVTHASSGQRSERRLTEAETDRVLGHEFGIDLPPRPTLDGIEPAILSNRTAVLATNGADGRPHLTAVWFVIEDGAICLSVTDDTQKARNLAGDVRCSVLVFHPATPDWYVEVRGLATVTDDADYEFADRLGSKYAADLRRFDGPGAHRVKIAIRPTRIITTDVR